MHLQLIQDGQGHNTGVYIPINDWKAIVDTHQDLKTLVNIEPTPKKTMKDFLGCISNETAEALHKEVLLQRNEWDERLKKQF